VTGPAMHRWWETTVCNDIKPSLTVQQSTQHC